MNVPNSAGARAARRSRVAVTFTDRDGVDWKLYEFGIMAGRPIRYPIGTVTGLYRGFLRVDTGERRALLMATKEWTARAHVLEPHELQRELDASTPWARDVAG